MTRKQYTIPRIKIISSWRPRLLGTSTEERMRWSGNRPGTAGPDEIDEESTFDAF